MTTFLVTVGIGLSTAAILSLSAVAFTLEYAVSRIANFAHGEFLTIGAYAAYSRADDLPSERRGRPRWSPRRPGWSPGWS